MLFENGAVDLVAGDLLVVVAGKTDDLDLFVQPGDDRVERPPLLRIVIPVDQIAGHYDQIGFQPVDSPYGFAACFDFAGHLPVVAPVTELGSDNCTITVFPPSGFTPIRTGWGRCSW